MTYADLRPAGKHPVSVYIWGTGQAGLFVMDWFKRFGKNCRKEMHRELILS